MKTRQPLYDQHLRGVSMIVAPGLLALSTFFWKDGEYGVQGGTMLVLAMVCWIPALTGLFGLLKDKMPGYAQIGLLIGIYGCVGGINFGFVGVYAAIFNISHQAYIAGFARYPLASNLLLFWPGPLFVLNLLVLGIQLIRTRSVPRWAGLLICLGALAFPASRIPRIELIAHLADALLLIPLVYIWWTFLSQIKMRYSHR